MADRTFKTDALVLLSRPLGEADRLITLLTWERGKISAVARGARKTKSKLAAGVDLFTYGQYILYQGRGLATITGQQVKEHFQYFRGDVALYPFGLYLAELTGKAISGEEPCRPVCHLLLEGWRLLGEDLDRELLCRAFELKLADLLGYRPNLNGCFLCGSPETAWFNQAHGSLTCKQCGGGGVRVAPDTVALAVRLLEAPLRQVRLLRALSRQKEELAGLTGSFLKYHLEIDSLRSLRFFRD
ncbi:MAG: DNA repair protein RecO [Firmicutes bacterium]|jgi:DNA repair protein RecO (recombination protein O)|nr:DNA repair protein RecO [Bacillota bacterium]